MAQKTLYEKPTLVTRIAKKEIRRYSDLGFDV